MIGTGLTRAEDPREGLYLTDGDSAVPAPVLGSTVEVKVTGIIARTRVTQIFHNPSRESVEGLYVFPLPDDAAVDSLRLRIGDRMIQGEIQEKQKAQQTYEAAKRQGAKAVLLEQQQPDVFTTTVAHVGPGETVEVVIELQQTVRYQNGKFALRFPLLVVPRGEAKGGLAGLSRIFLPAVFRRGSARISPFAFHAELNPGFPLASVESPTHEVIVEKSKTHLRYAVDLRSGTAPADGGLSLEWRPAVGREPRGIYYSEEVDGEHYALLMVMPPDSPQSAASRLAREVVFVIDTSRSMQGTAIEQAREAVLLALRRLQPTDWFNIVQFNSAAHSLFAASAAATADNIDQAAGYLRSLATEGESGMGSALRTAVTDGSVSPFAVRQIVLITDGQVEKGEEDFCLCFVRNHLGDRSLFTVAIGSTPNAHLLRKMAELGRGTFTAVPTASRLGEAMNTLFAQLEAPMLHHLEVLWNDVDPEVWPAQFPDLYLGEPLVVTARLRTAAGAVEVAGGRGGKVWQDALPSPAAVQGAGIDKLWARQKIESLIDSLSEGALPQDIRREVTELGLRYHLTTDYTSLVAADAEVTSQTPVEPVTPVGTAVTEMAAARIPATQLEKAFGASTEEVQVLAVMSPDVVSLSASPPLEDLVVFDEVEVAPAVTAAEGLCEEIRRTSWKELTLERALAVAPALAEDLRKADGAGLLRGFVALILEGKDCSEPPAEVRAESQGYIARFGRPGGPEMN